MNIVRSNGYLCSNRDAGDKFNVTLYTCIYGNNAFLYINPAECSRILLIINLSHYDIVYKLYKRMYGIIVEFCT